jgi:hypothetical protein
MKRGMDDDDGRKFFCENGKVHDELCFDVESLKCVLVKATRNFIK